MQLENSGARAEAGGWVIQLNSGTPSPPPIIQSPPVSLELRKIQKECKALSDLKIRVHLSINRHLGCFHILTTINNATLNIKVHIYFFELVFLFFSSKEDVVYNYIQWSITQQ